MGVCHKHLFPTMKKIFTFILLSMIAFNAVHAEITWTLSNDGTLTISGTDMPDFDYYTEPYWNSQKQKIKKIVLKNGVTKIGSYAFYNCNNLTSITIPNSVTSIRMYAFEDCLRLTSITIPNSVTSIGDGAFEGCSGLTSIIVEEGSSEFDSRNNCNAIIRTKSNSLIAGCKNTVIPNSVTRIEGFAFHGCTSLTSITIPNSVTSIGHNAFSLCTGLTSITIPNSVTEVELNAFGGTKWYNRQPDGLVYAGLVLYKYKGTMPTNTIIVVNGGTKGIADAAFGSCVGLTSITIPNSVTNIGMYAFQGCTDLTTITIPNSVTSIEGFAFHGCTGLTSITIPNSVTSIGQNAFSLCTGLTSITIPNSVTSIRASAFDGCSGLTSITIPNSVTNIGQEAFRDCSGLTSITIPNSVTSIGWTAFYGCSGLTSITCEASTPPNCYFDCFNNVKKNIPIYVPANSIEAYKAANGWKDFTNIQAIIIEPASIAFADASENLIVGKTMKLEIIISPKDATAKTITWTSSNTDVATVSSEGVVTAKGAGTTIITATTNNGKTAKCTITVKQPVTAIALSETTTSLWVGKTKTLTATATPTTANNTAVIWSSSNNNVATVSSKGVVTAKGQGTCTITCTAADGYGAKSTCEVTVKQQVNSITLSDATTSLWVGKTKALTATANPTTASNTSVTWSSSDNKVAIVSSKGVITAKGKGTCTITCMAADGYGTKSTCEVTVKQQVNSISLSDATTTLWLGKTKTLTATVTPTTSSNTAVNWVSSDNNVATVSSKGVVTAKGQGTCIITCTAADGYGTKTTCEVIVKQQVAEIALSETTASLWVGDTKTITATATPTNANNTNVTWSSSDNSIATVSSKGIITAKGQGTCTITCTASDGYGTKSTCKVTVKQQVNSIDFGYETLTMTCGDEKTLTPTINPSNADVKTLTWKSTDKSVATITSEGVLTAVSPGTATITCTATDDFKKSSSITVIVEPLDITITDKNPTIKDGTYREGGISYTRTLTKNKHTTFCMPYDVNLSDYTEYFSQVYVPMEMAFVKSGGKLMVMFKSVSLTEKIRAGQPFIALASKSGTVAIKNGSKITITSLEEPMPTNLEVYNYGGNLLSRNTDVDVKITGNYSIVTDLDDANNFTFSVNGQMVGATTVSPYRFYITKNDERSSAKITDILLSFDGEEATGVEDIINEQKGDDKFYNLNGQRINKAHAQKGVYIFNGKKILVK